MDPHKTSDDPEHPRSLEECAEGEVFDLLPGEGLLDPGLNFGTGGFDEFAVFDARGAGGFTGAATEAKGHVFQVASVHGSGTCGDLNHLVDAAAGGIHFNAEFPVCRAGVEAEAAVDTLVEIFLLRGVGMAAAHDAQGSVRFGHKASQG